MKKRKKKDSKNIVLTLIFVLTVFIIALLLFMTYSKTPVEKELNKAGYTTNNEDAFYNNVVSNNTIDEYYNKVTNNEDAIYEEYYISKESLNFIELKMENKSNVQTTLNITSSLRSGAIYFNYERTYNNSHLILEGDSMSNYECNVIAKENIKDRQIDEICNSISVDINGFILKQNELLENEEIRALAKEPIKEYVEK